MAKSDANLGTVSGQVQHELARLRKEWWWLLIVGIGLVIAGTVAISAPLITSLVGVVFLGVLMLMAGIGQIVSAFWEGQWKGFLLHLMGGILYAVVGAMMLKEPGEGLLAVTLLVAVFLMVGGLFRIAAAMQLKFHNWGWPLLHGIVSLFLGIVIWAQMPVSALWVIGLMIGIEMLFNGWTWVMLALNVRSIPIADGD